MLPRSFVRAGWGLKLDISKVYDDAESLRDGTEGTNGFAEGSMATVNVPESGEDERLDLFLSCSLGLARSFVQKLIKEGHVFPEREGKKIKPGLRVRQGQAFRVEIPPLRALDLEPEPVPFGVVYEDSDLLVIEKPGGIVVHPAPGHWTGTLVHGLLYRYPDIGCFNGVQRPGIVHRLDRGTSGLMVVARNPEISEGLIEAFRQRTIRKEYLALAWGCPSRARAEIDAPIGRDHSNRLKMAAVEWGKPARTRYKVLWSRKRWSLIRCELLTGRTHQIRVHLKLLGCPLVGDRLYAPERQSPFSEDRFFLHSWRLGFVHPRTGKELSFNSPLPEDLKSLLGESSARGSDLS